MSGLHPVPTSATQPTPFNTTDEVVLSVNGAVGKVAPPLLSFVLINWNYARFIGDALRSILGQDYPHFECVVVDNGSDDDSIATAERVIANDPRFRIVRLPTNRGQLAAALVGFKETTGPFVAFIDSDDVLLPSFASMHLQVHLALENAVAVTTSQVIEVDGELRALTAGRFERAFGADGGGGLLERHSAIRLSSIADDQYDLLRSKTTVRADRTAPGWLWSPGTANVVRRSVADLFAGEADKVEMRFSDGYFLPLCHSLGGTVAITVPLSLYRFHGANVWSGREWVGTLRKQATDRKHPRGSRYQNLEPMLRHAAKLRTLAGSSFWTALDIGSRLGGPARKRLYDQPEPVALFKTKAEDLLSASGLEEFATSIAARFSFRSSLAIMRAAYGGRMPREAWLALVKAAFPQRRRKKKKR